MTRRAEQIPLDDDWVLTKVWSKSRAAPAILAAIQAVPRDEATPVVTPPEPPPVVYPPNCEGLSVGEALTLIHEERGD